MAQRCLHLLALLTCTSKLLECSSLPQCEREAPGCNQHGIDEVEDVALLQTQLQRVSSRSPLDARGGEPHCAPMTNHGSFFTVPTQVGTPPQTFDIVADTGSNSLLVPDCRCVFAELCGQLKNCFHTKASSSFLLKTTDSGAILLATLSYGSGDIVCTISSEDVMVGGVHAHMVEGVFLMENTQELAIGGQFQGILGLGVPSSGSESGLLKTLFMQEAGVSRYSLCFNNVGTLRMNVPPLENAMGNIGTVHWGLDMRGMSVGDAKADVLFCDPSSKLPGMVSACGVIPDSGTTLTLGPPDQIKTLYGGICSAWPRCNALAQQNPKIPTGLLFHALVVNCTDWMSEENGGIDEIPPIDIHLAGAEGVTQKVPLTAWSYIVMTVKPVYKKIIKDIFGHELTLLVPTGERDYSCSPMFGPIVMETVLNGPIWILGSSLFWDHTVSFDVGTVPNGIAIGSEPCTSCQASLLATSSESAEASKSVHRALRRIDSLRKTSINHSHGF